MKGQAHETLLLFSYFGAKLKFLTCEAKGVSYTKLQYTVSTPGQERCLLDKIIRDVMRVVKLACPAYILKAKGYPPVKLLA